MRRSAGSWLFFHFRSAALRLRLSARTESDSHGAGGVNRAGLEVSGQRLSRESERAESRVLVAVSGGRRENESMEGREEVTDEERSAGVRERR